MRALLLIGVGLLVFASVGRAQSELVGGYGTPVCTIDVRRSDGEMYFTKAWAFYTFSEERLFKVQFSPGGNKFDCEIVVDAAGGRGEVRRLEMRFGGSGRIIARDVLLDKKVVGESQLELDEEDASEMLRNFHLVFYRHAGSGGGGGLRINFTLRDPDDGFTYRVDVDAYRR